MRIVSLVPSATSLVYSLGLGDCLVGVSHQCRYPAEVSRLPRVTRSLVDMPGNPGDINQVVQLHARAQQPLYAIDVDLLRSLEPDVILAQDTCSVCSVTFDALQQAGFDQSLETLMIPVNINSLHELFSTLGRLGQVLAVPDRAAGLSDHLRKRLQGVRAKASAFGKVSVLAAEWVTPLLPAGDLINELLRLAGGEPLLPASGNPHGELPWEQVLSADPDVILVFPCGCSLDKAIQHAEHLSRRPHWHRLTAVRQRRVFLLDGSVCTRYDARIIDVAELFVDLLHGPGTVGDRYTGLVLPWCDPGRGTA